MNSPFLNLEKDSTFESSYNIVLRFIWGDYKPSNVNSLEGFFILKTNYAEIHFTKCRKPLYNTNNQLYICSVII